MLCKDNLRTQRTYIYSFYQITFIELCRLLSISRVHWVQRNAEREKRWPSKNRIHNGVNRELEANCSFIFTPKCCSLGFVLFCAWSIPICNETYSSIPLILCQGIRLGVSFENLLTQGPGLLVYNILDKSCLKMNYSLDFRSKSDAEWASIKRKKNRIEFPKFARLSQISIPVLFSSLHLFIKFESLKLKWNFTARLNPNLNHGI